MDAVDPWIKMTKTTQHVTLCHANLQMPCGWIAIWGVDFRHMLMVTWDIDCIVKFVRTEKVLAIINSAETGMISNLPLLQELNLPGLKNSIFYVEIENFRSKDPY